MLAPERRFDCEAENQGAVEPRKQPAKLPGDLRAACLRLVSQSFRILQRRLAPTWPYLMVSHVVLECAPELLNVLVGTPPRRIPGKI